MAGFGFGATGGTERPSCCGIWAAFCIIRCLLVTVQCHVPSQPMSSAPMVSHRTSSQGLAPSSRPLGSHQRRLDSNSSSRPPPLGNRLPARYVHRQRTVLQVLTVAHRTGVWRHRDPFWGCSIHTGACIRLHVHQHTPPPLLLLLLQAFGASPAPAFGASPFGGGAASTPAFGTANNAFGVGALSKPRLWHITHCHTGCETGWLWLWWRDEQPIWGRIHASIRGRIHASIRRRLCTCLWRRLRTCIRPASACLWRNPLWWRRLHARIRRRLYACIRPAAAAVGLWRLWRPHRWQPLWRSGPHWCRRHAHHPLRQASGDRHQRAGH